MSFIDYRLSTQICDGSTGGPQWSTAVVTTTGGQRYTNRKWTYPLHTYNLEQGIRDNADFEEVRSLFYICGGQADSFRFRDPLDHELTRDNSTLELISGSVYQIQRVYTLGSLSFVRPIYKPASDTGNSVVVYRTRSGAVSVATATVDYSTGQATLSDHTDGDTYTCTGDFDVPVHFTSDIAEFQRKILNGGRSAAGWDNIEVQEERL
jgi:uncharacterized protein (TIGR02217 family)